MRSTAYIFIANLKDYEIAEKTKHYIQVNHVIETPKIKIARAEKILKKANINFMVDLKLLIYKTGLIRNCYN